MPRYSLDEIREWRKSRRHLGPYPAVRMVADLLEEIDSLSAELRESKRVLGSLWDEIARLNLLVDRFKSKRRRHAKTP